jgi:sigma-B regulation protein RsbU (phosphoserine phosphatase)
LYRDALEKARLDQEMATAAQIQQALLPTRNRAGAFFDAAAEMLACRSIGGDFFEYVDLPDGSFGFALGDVSGKGPPAALLGALLQGSLAAQSITAAGPAKTLSGVNSALVHRGIEARFVTLFYAVLSATGELSYCNAGHNPPFLVGRNGIQRLETGGMPLGLFDPTPLDQGTVTMEPGDFVVTFSDGVSEAMNAEGEEFEDERIQSSIDGSAHDAQAQLEHLFSSVKTFTAGAAQNDDVTVLVVSYRGITT